MSSGSQSQPEIDKKYSPGPEVWSQMPLDHAMLPQGTKVEAPGMGIQCGKIRLQDQSLVIKNNLRTNAQKPRNQQARNISAETCKNKVKILNQ